MWMGLREKGRGGIGDRVEGLEVASRGIGGKRSFSVCFQFLNGSDYSSFV